MSTAQAKENQLQGRWILRQGWVPHKMLTTLLHHLQSGASGDLCTQLLSRGLIDQSQASAARKAARRAISQSFRTQKVSDTSEHSRHQSQRDSAGSPSDRQQAPIKPPEPQEIIETRIDASSQDGGLDNSLAKSHRELLAGDLFRDYEILEEISRGAMGVIFRARHCISEQICALKFILQDQPDETEIGRFRLEAETLIQLNHDHIVKISDFGSANGRLYYAMELIDGHDLYTCVQNSLRTDSKVPEFTESMLYLKDIALALAYCHERDVLHRDIKPQNILIERDTGRAVLVDFGLRKKLQDDSKGLTKTGEILGTPAFMSPEQFSPGGSFGEIGPATDVWAFGATIFFAMTGKSPFDKNTMVAIFQAITFEVPPTLRSINPETPEWLDQLCADCLQKQASMRPTISEIVARLEDQNLESIAEGPQFKSALRGVSLAGLLLVLAIAVLFIATLFEAAPLEFSKIEQLPSLVNKRTLVIKGKINQATVSITSEASSEETLSREDGTFALTVHLKDGANKIRIGGKYREQSATPYVINIHCDLSPPIFNIKGLVEGQRIDTEEDNVLSGTINDTHRPELYFIDGEGQPLARNGAFRHPLADIAAPQKITIEATDKAGNKRQVTYLVYTQRAQAFQKFTEEQRQQLDAFVTERSTGLEERELLLNLCQLNLWEGCSEKTQDHTIELVTKRLGSDFEFVEAALQSCEQLSFNIATFKHKKTGIELQLIPGGLRTTRWWRAPLYEWTIRFLEVLASDDCDQRIITASLILPPSEDYIEDFMAKQKIKMQVTGTVSPMRAFQLTRRFNKSKIEDFKRWIKQRIETKRSKNQSKEITDFIPPFLIAKRELSTKEWESIEDAPDQSGGDGAYPVLTNLKSARLWLEKTNSQLRPPSRQEWSIAAAGGSIKLFFWGDDLKPMYQYANVSRGFMPSTPQAVTNHDKKTNAFGLSNVYGNVSEWVDPNWASWQRCWPNAPTKNTTFKTIGPRYFKEWGLSLGGASYLSGALCKPQITQYHPFPNKLESFSQSVGLRVAASIP
jgi:serine/threonine protein kinase